MPEFKAMFRLKSSMTNQEKKFVCSVLTMYMYALFYTRNLLLGQFEQGFPQPVSPIVGAQRSTLYQTLQVFTSTYYFVPNIAGVRHSVQPWRHCSSGGNDLSWNCGNGEQLNMPVYTIQIHWSLKPFC